MAESYNIYCDESCHLEHDRQKVMVLGAVWCREEVGREFTRKFAELAGRHNVKGELKWNKVSKASLSYYLELVDLFFNTQGLNYRCLVVDDKSKLDHQQFNLGSHDAFYYKMYYYLLRNIIAKDNRYKIYIDIKDTRGRERIQLLREILCRSMCDFEYQLISSIQHVRSHEVRLLQLTDFLTGAVSYHHRRIKGSEAKRAVVARILQHLNTDLLRSTPPWEEKFNLFVFTPTEVQRSAR
ncbi:MAG: DUF3800 domain-containing protein [candidate division WOR-3 bacterium]